MTKQHIGIMRQFAAAVRPWFDSLSSKEKCTTCGCVPNRMLQLGDAVQGFLTAYDERALASKKDPQ